MMPDYDEEFDRVAAAILRGSANEQEALGHMTLAASHFIGAAAGLLRRISEKKGGPVLDAVGWSEEVTKMIIAESKRSLRQ